MERKKNLQSKSISDSIEVKKKSCAMSEWNFVLENLFLNSISTSIALPLFFSAFTTIID